MALTNEQYDQILREYEIRRRDNEIKSAENRARLEEGFPKLKELEDRLSRLYISGLMKDLDGEGRNAEETEKEAAAIKKEIHDMLDEQGFSEGDLEPICDCYDCHDTGFIIGEDGIKTKCHCFKARELELLYENSHLGEQVKRCNFDNVSYEGREGEDLESLKRAVSKAKDFAENFGKDFRNIIFYGTVGTGKSFLSYCISDVLLKSHRSVIYMSANDLFDRIGDISFRMNEIGERNAAYRELTDCDLLVIDDLGTELTNAFTESELFALLNGRLLNRRSTIISTNLDLSDIRDRYSDRVFSRLAGDYEFVKLVGKDFRFIRRENA